MRPTGPLQALCTQDSGGHPTSATLLKVRGEVQQEWRTLLCGYREQPLYHEGVRGVRNRLGLEGRGLQGR